MFVPVLGRAGSPPVPPDVLLALVVAALALAACSWLLPLVVAARGVNKVAAALLAVGAASWLLVLCGGGAAYSASRPQRLMLFHVRRSVHGPAGPATDHLYWIPELDANTPHALDDYVPELRAARETDAGDCVRWPYCGAPYYLPVLRLVPRAHSLPAPPPPPPAAPAAPAAPLYAHTELSVERRRLEPTLEEIHLNITGPSHIVVIISPVEGAHVEWSNVLDELREAAPWGSRRTHFLSLHAARPPRAWRLALRLRTQGPAEGALAALSVAGHGMGEARTPQHEALLGSFPPHAAPTGWPVHLHLLHV